MPINEEKEPIEVFFYRTDGGCEPVREWILSLPAEERKIIGEDIKTVQFGWPIGMPLIAKIAPNLWEVRSRLRSGSARTIFTVQEKKIVLLHGFKKKTNKIPKEELRLARQRLAEIGK